MIIVRNTKMRMVRQTRESERNTSQPGTSQVSKKNKQCVGEWWAVRGGGGYKAKY